MTAVLPCRPASSEVPALLPVVGADTLVPLAPAGQARYVNLDVAASAPALTAVVERVAEALPLYASVHRGAGWLSQVSTALYESARDTVAAFVGARPDDVCVLARNTTDALNLLAGCLPAGADVLVLDCEHHADLLPWQQRARAGSGGCTVLPTQDTVAGTLLALGTALDTGRYALVAVTGASNVTGESLPLARVVDRAHAAGARVLVDGAQSVPHRRFSLTDSGADYVAFSGHKTYAPYGVGALVGRRDWLDGGRPHLAGGGAVQDVDVTSARWAAAPHRHEGGSPNVLGAIALAAACDELAGLAPGELEAHERALRAELVAGLSAVPGVRLLRIWSDSVDPTGVVSFTVEGADPGLVAAYLSAEHGVGVRDGRFCAHPLLARLGVPAGALRASVGVGSTSADVARLVGAVAAFVQDGPAVAYALVEGRWQPAEDPRVLPPAARGAASTRAAACGPAPA